MNNKKINKKIEKTKEKRTIASAQIIILIIATIAFSWMIGSEVKIISAEDECTTTGETRCNGNIYEICTTSKTWVTVDTCTSTETCVVDVGCVAKTTTTETKEDNKAGELALTALTSIGAKALENTAVEQAKKSLPKLFGKEVGEKVVTTTGEEVTEKASQSLLKTFFKGPAGGAEMTIWGNIFRNAVWATATYMVINYFAKKYASERNLADISTVTMIGAGLGVIIGVIAGESVAGPVGWIAAAITAVSYGAYMIIGYQTYSREVFTFRVGMWQPPEGGSNCNKCNALRIAGENECSEYICHSYGLACEWVNDETKYETCIEVNVGDKSPPVITPAKEIYGESVFPDNTKYDYQTSSAGARIIYTGEGGEAGNCVPAFTPIKLALKTNENANCKISIEPVEAETAEEKFNLMTDMGEGTSFTKNHTLKLPSIVTASESSLELAGYQLTNGGNYRFYIRCKDVRGNINQIDYQMSFCVQSGPDTNPPEITGTTPAKDSFIAYGTNNISDFQVYTNEPADCKWDFQPKSYEFMNYNFDKCSQNINDQLRGFDFGCQGNLTGFKNGVENKYYIACIDQPELKGTAKENKRNAGDPEAILFKGTKQLLIQDVKINGKANGTTISDSVENINVKLEVMTFGGAEEGKARCKYSEDKTLPRTYSLFDNNNNREYLTTNVQNLYMGEGAYTYFLQCFDIAGNAAETMVNFSVEIDNDSPNIVRVYKEDDYLKLVTDEEAECVYSNFGCVYDIYSDGELLDSSDGINHLTEWNIESDLYIKCKDMYGNQPAPDVCSLIARPFEILQTQSSE
jgi:hypothetical protein